MKEAEIIRPAGEEAETGEQPVPVLLLALICGTTMGTLAAITGSLLIAVAAALMIPLIAWRPVLGLMGLVLLVPFEELTTFEFSFTLLRVVGAATFVCWFFQFIRKRQVIKWDLFLGVALLFLAWSACSLLWAVDRDRGTGVVLTIAQLVLLYWMSSHLIDSEAKFRAVMGSYVVGAATAAIIAAFGVYEAGFAARASVSSLQDPNRFAHSLSVGLFLAAFLNATCRGCRRYLFLATGLLLGFGVLFSGSRGTWLAVLASIAAACLFTKSKFFKLTLLALLIFVLFFNSAIMGALPPLIADRVASIVDPADRGGGRLDIWMVGLEMVRENWPVGVGINSFPAAYNDYIFKSAAEMGSPGVMRDAHNSFLCILAELGLLGFLLFSMFWLISLKTVGKLHGDPEKTLGICMLVYLFFVALTGSEYSNKFFWVALLIVNLLPLSKAKS